MSKKMKLLWTLFNALLLHPVKFINAAKKHLREIYLFFENEKIKISPDTWNGKSVSRINVDKYEFLIPQADVPAFCFQWQEIFVEKQYLFFCQSSNPVILDLGANVGTATMFFSRKYPNAIIEVYEPDPLIFSVLSENLKRNKVKASLHNDAVWVSNGKIAFEPDGADGGRLVPEGSNGTHLVSCVDIRDIIMRYPRIELLKIDIEGAENEVIPRLDGHLSHVERLFVEYHERRGKPQGLAEILSVLSKNDLKYTIFNLSDCIYSAFSKSWDHPNYSQQLIIYAYR